MGGEGTWTSSQQLKCLFAAARRSAVNTAPLVSATGLLLCTPPPRVANEGEAGSAAGAGASNARASSWVKVQPVAARAASDWHSKAGGHLMASASRTIAG
jgi:hypothetical protein